ncbi:MAG: ADP-ribosylglycohydrolase family protein [Myxococcales bacterium]|nr:ADP-ribosylglycohydrolase family protein [Myxococcales bacterium]MCB9533050.1 ADP-ribosylglycohydrolase family protein [Myxococcales bacterium]
MTTPPAMLDAKGRASQSLNALALGDAFGELFFTHPLNALVGVTPLPAAPWRWTDDTHMAISIVEELVEHGRVLQDDLAARFAQRFAAEPWRGYAGGAKHVLGAIAAGGRWADVAGSLFDGTGSYGNGAAMRVAPLGAFFANDVSRATREARLSAEVTHSHEEAVAGAIAVAIAAALRWSEPRLSGVALIDAVAQATPASRTRDRLVAARGIADREFRRAASELGTGNDVAAWDTVPFCVWMASHHHADFDFALRATAGGLGDRDTTCAIVAGILAPAVDEVPEEWVQRAEPVPPF